MLVFVTFARKKSFLAFRNARPLGIKCFSDLKRRNEEQQRHDHTSKVMEQSQKSQKMALFATGAGAGANLFLFVSKGMAGYAVGSTALIADCLGSLGDMCTDAIVYYSVKQARLAASPDRPWGMGKLEPIGAFVVSGVLGLTGAGIGYSAIGAVWEMLQANPEFMSSLPIVFGGSGKVVTGLPIEEVLGPSTEAVYAALSVSVISMIIKEALFRYTVRAGILANSAAVVANAWQHRSDVMVSAAVFSGLAGAHMGYPILDPAVAVLVAGIIIRQAGEMGMRSLKDLSDAPASKTETEALKATVVSIKGIESIQDLKARQSGPFLYVECTVGVSGQLSASTAHRLAELVKRRLKSVHAGRVSNAIVHVVPLGRAGLGEKTGDNNSKSHFYFKRKVLSTLVPGSKPLDKDDSSEDPDSDSEDDRQDYLVDEFECLKNITAVEEVQVYYRDDGRVSLKVDVTMNPNITIREAHKIAVMAAKLIHARIEGVADVDVDLELDEGAWGSGGSTPPSSVKAKIRKED